ncbi:MAG TPA: glycosyltransferase family 4 protein [Vicinamibacterales bacterium]|nr:glycosyltransferase family 4 protein [Vicinamibacterales bacterium]
MKVLIATDAFPPLCGGSGWSTYELVRGLRARGHDVSVVRPRPGQPAGVRTTDYDGVSVTEMGVFAPDLPYVRNYFKSERLRATLAALLARMLRQDRFDLVHAQHVMTAAPSIDAAHAAGVPAVVTVRDYWPVCYWSDLLHTRSGLTLCPACTTGHMTQCVRPRAGGAWPLALPLIPYMRANLARKRTSLAEADAVIAVSTRLAADLRQRTPELASTRIDVIPNAVDVAALRARVSAVPPLDVPYALYLGKLAPNKGTDALIDVVSRAGLDWPLVVAGDGPGRARLQREAAASGRDVRFLGWVDEGAAATWLAHAALLIFPSRGPESLSRVLIEGSALGVPIAAMETGGTRDIIEPGVTGLLSGSPEALAADVARLQSDPDLRQRLGAAAARRVDTLFEAASVVARVEQVYRELVKTRQVSRRG